MRESERECVCVRERDSVRKEDKEERRDKIESHRNKQQATSIIISTQYIILTLSSEINSCKGRFRKFIALPFKLGFLRLILHAVVVMELFWILLKDEFSLFSLLAGSSRKSISTSLGSLETEADSVVKSRAILGIEGAH